MHVLEKHIEADVCRWARKNGIIPLKLTPEGLKGYPDRLFLLSHGTVVFIEFKRPGQKPYPLQEYRMRELRKRHFNVHVCSDRATAIRILEAARISENGNAPDDKSGVCRTPVGPGLGEDLYYVRGFQDFT